MGDKAKSVLREILFGETCARRKMRRRLNNAQRRESISGTRTQLRLKQVSILKVNKNVKRMCTLTVPYPYKEWKVHLPVSLTFTLGSRKP